MFRGSIGAWSVVAGVVMAIAASAVGLFVESSSSEPVRHAVADCIEHGGSWVNGVGCVGGE